MARLRQEDKQTDEGKEVNKIKNSSHGLTCPPSLR